MANDKETYRPLTVGDVTKLLEVVGYETVTLQTDPLSDSPLNPTVFLGKRVSKRRGSAIVRAYAVYPINKRGDCIIGWSHHSSAEGGGITRFCTVSS